VPTTRKPAIIGIMRGVVALIAVSLLAAVTAQDRPLPEYTAFAARVKARLAVDEERQAGYMFLERRTERKLDGGGRVQSTSTKLYEVYPGLPGEDRYRRLIEEDGRPVSTSALAKADRERQEKVETYMRQEGRQSPASAERSRAARRRVRYQGAVDDLFRVYDIHVDGRATVGGRDTIVATLAPRRSVTPVTDDGKVMLHFRAKAWVDEAGAELVRVEAEALDDLTYGWGLLARIEKGATGTYERRLVDGSAWLPARVTWHGAARVLLLKQLRREGVAEYSNYRKFTVDTTTTYPDITR
jgi:hypothetical protein